MSGEYKSVCGMAIVAITATLLMLSMPAFPQLKTDSSIDWALGGWSGKIFQGSVAYVAHLTVERNSKGGVTCQLQTPGTDGYARSDTCEVTADLMRFGQGIVEIELRKSGTTGLFGTHKKPGTARMMLSLSKE